MQIPSFAFTVFDTETTGLEAGYDHIFELAVVRHEEGEKVAEYDSLYAVPKELPPFVQVLTRVQQSDLEGKTPLSDDREQFEKLFDDALIIGHNVLFDIGMMKGEGLNLAERPWVDTAMLASIVFPELESYSLPFLSKVLDLPHEPQHRALGDVHATLALLEKIWERLCSLPAKKIQMLKEVAARSPEGYKLFLEAIPDAGGGAKWLTAEKKEWKVDAIELPALSEALESTPEEGAIGTVTASLSSGLLQATLRHCVTSEKKGQHVWIATKNLDAAVRRLPEDLLEKISILRPTPALLDLEAKKSFDKQKQYTTDECTLACKLALYEGKIQSEFPLHGSEYDVWKGKIACTDDSPAYTTQFDHLKNVMLIDHRHLLSLTQQQKFVEPGDRLIIDDASMLEDTATKAFQWSANADTLRAAAEGNEDLTRFLDAYQMWTAKVRGDLDVRYITEMDITMPEVKGLRDRLSVLLETEMPPQMRSYLDDLFHLLDPKNLEGRIIWLEKFRNGGESLKSVPLDIAQMLWEYVYDSYPTTLLLPPGDSTTFPGIIPPQIDVQQSDISGEKTEKIDLSYADEHLTLDRLLPCAEGKIIVLIGSKRTIADMYVKHAVALEEKGVTLIAQGMSGGQGRMQAEFTQAGAPAIWLLTPWTYEGVDIPSKSVDRLFINTMPFDHPSHTVLSLRADRMKNGFTDYMLPRMEQRIFRLLRTYDKHRKEDADILILDSRLHEKAYGKDVKEYVEKLLNSKAKS